jgi:predicted nucleic acid-binding protein
VKLLLDTNVVLDFVLNRAPWAVDARTLFAKIERGRATGFLAGHTVTTIHYVSAKMIGGAATAAAIADLLRLFEIVPVEKADFFQAVGLPVSDFEDAVQMICALKVGADYIVTRDERDFQSSMVQARSPGAVLALLQ